MRLLLVTLRLYHVSKLSLFVFAKQEEGSITLKFVSRPLRQGLQVDILGVVCTVDLFNKVSAFGCSPDRVDLPDDFRPGPVGEVSLPA